MITYSGGNIVYGDDGDDLVYLNGDFHESAEGGDGHDHIWALGATTASVYGNGGGDLLVGSPGEDFLHGGDDNDVLLGNGGSDSMSGDAGNDELRGGAALDTLNGGEGAADECIDDLGGAVPSGCEVVTTTPGADVPAESP